MIGTPHLATNLNLVFEPKVYLVGMPQLGPDIQRFLDDHDIADWRSSSEIPAEIIPELGGRLCYMSFGNPRPGGNAAYLERIKAEKHGSVLEHATFTLIFAGVSRSLTHELVRHRAGMSYSQLSQRYVDESDVAFVIPPAMIDNVEQALAWMVSSDRVPTASSVELVAKLKHRSDDPATDIGLRWLAGRWENLDEYRHLVDSLVATGRCRSNLRKQVREAARSTLPNCTETKIQVTGNGRSWRHFIEQRGSGGADAEIRRLAFAVLATLAAAAPNLFGDYVMATAADGVDYIATPYPKV